jgi:carboxymethylenebutenolidase
MNHTMTQTTEQIHTQDGVCPSHVFEPDGTGPWPGVLMFMDGVGIRPALFEMGERLASSGYHVLLPDLFYRIGPTSFDARTLFSDPAKRAYFMEHVRPAASQANIMRDMPAFFAHFDAAPHVKHGPIGVVGYCMGGGLALAAAGLFPDRVAAAASYHGAGLAGSAPDSPHLLAPHIKARVYVAGAIEDAGFDDAQKARLEQALANAGVRHAVTTYNAKHGWVPTDTPVHDAAAAERHWQTLLDLLAAELGQ